MASCNLTQRKKNISTGVEESSPLSSGLSSVLGGDNSKEYKSLELLLNSNEHTDEFNAYLHSKGLDTKYKYTDIVDNIRDQIEKFKNPSFKETQDQLDRNKSLSNWNLYNSFDKNVGDPSIDVINEYLAYSINKGVINAIINDKLMIDAIINAASKISLSKSTVTHYKDEIEVDPNNESVYTSKDKSKSFIRASSMVDDMFSKIDPALKKSETKRRVIADFEQFLKEGRKGYVDKGGQIVKVDKNGVISTIDDEVNRRLQYSEKRRQQGQLFHAVLSSRILSIKNSVKSGAFDAQITQTEALINSLNGSLGLDISEVATQADLMLKETLTSIDSSYYNQDGPDLSNEKWLDVGTEETIAVDMDNNFNVLSNKVSGMASTVDIVIRNQDSNGNSTYTIIDAKNVSHDLSDNGEKLVGTNLKNNTKTENKVKLVLNALMLKAREPNARIENLILTYTQGEIDKDLGKIQSLSVMKEMQDILNGLKVYFNKVNPRFVSENQQLFQFSSYMSEPPVIIKEKKALSLKYYTDKIDPLVTSIDDYIQSNLSSFVSNKIRSIQADMKALPDNSEASNTLKSELIQFIEAKSYLETGKRYLKNTRVSKRQASMTHSSMSDNQYIQMYHRSFEEANNTLNSFLSKLSSKTDKLFSKVKPSSVVGLNPDYKDMYSWMYKKDEAIHRYEKVKYGTIKLITYEDAEWNSLNQNQKDFLDQQRWTIRYTLFRTMNPLGAVPFITKELNRTDLSKDSRELLENQLKELQAISTGDKFKIDNYNTGNPNSDFKYYEGWVPSMKKMHEANSFLDGKNTLKNIYEKTTSELMSFMDDEFVKKDEDGLPDYGLKVNWFNAPYLEKENGVALDYEDHFDKNFSYNLPQAIYEFAYSMERKRVLDDVYFLGKGISTMLANEKDGNVLNEHAISMINNQLLINIRGQKKEDLGKAEILGKEINVDRFARTSGAVARWMTMSLNIAGGIGSSLGASVIIMKRVFDAFVSGTYGAITGVGKHTYDTNAISLDYFVGLGIGAWAQARATFGVAKTAFNVGDASDNGMANKLNLISKEIGFKPDDIQMLIKENGFNVQPLIHAGRVQDVAFFSYKVVDSINYNALLYASLKNMKIKGTDISVWDAYYVEDGELKWKDGVVRGIDKENGKVITRLTAKEIQSLKFSTTKVMGSMRPEEKTAMDASTLTSLFSTFKRFLPGLIDGTIGGLNEESSLGYYIETGQVDANGLPIYDWVSEKDQGSVRNMFELSVNGFKTLATTLRFAQTAKQDREQFMMYWESLSRHQKRGLVGVITTFITGFFILGSIAADWEDEDKEEGLEKPSFATRILKKTTNGLGPFYGFTSIFDYSGIPVYDILSKFPELVGTAASNLRDDGKLSGATENKLNDYMILDPFIETKKEEELNNE